MATNELQAKITADISGLESELKKAEKLQKEYAKSISDTQKEIAQNIAISRQYEKAIEQLQKEFKEGAISQTNYRKQLQKLRKDEAETEIATKDLRKELARLKRDQKDLVSGTDGLSNGLGGVKKSATNVTPTLLEFNRTIQDAPFGIQGVANNIQQLTANFGSLKKSAGGTIPALKSLAAGFIGPQGILFAVSAVTAGLVAYQNGAFDSADSTKKLGEEAEKNKEALDNYIDSLRGVDASTLDAQKSSAEELITLKALRAQIEDTSLSTAEREDGIVKLRKQFPAYFQDIENEKLLNGQAASAYDVLTNSITKRARATAALDLLVENAKAEFDASRRLLQIEQELQQVQADKIKSKAEEARLNESIGQNRGVTTGTQLVQQRKTFDLVQKENDLIEERLRLFQQIGTAQLDNIDLERQITENIVVEPTVSGGGNKPRVQAAKDTSKLLLKLDKELFLEQEKLAIQAALDVTNEVNKIYEESGAQASDALGFKKLAEDIDATERPILELENRLDLINSKFNVLGGRNPLRQSLQNFVEGLNNSDLTPFEKKLNELDLASSVLAQGFNSSFQSMSQSLSRSLITGSEFLDGFVSSIIQSLGQLASALVQNAIKQIAINKAVATSNAIAGATASGAATGPGAIFSTPAFIASMVALVAGAFGSIGSFASGGIVPGGSFQGDKVPAFVNSGEMILNRGQQKNLFDILNNNLSSLQGRSAQSGSFATTSVLRGEDIYLMVQRQERKDKRFNGV